MAVNMNTSQFLGLDVDRRATSPTPGTSLPEDDGMRSLRLKMHEIRNLAASTEEKARAMHLLMTKDYITMNHPDHDMPDLFAQGPLCHPVRSNDNPYNITPQDLEPSYCSDHINDEGTGLGCAHYSRNVKVQCFDCNQWHPCRHCHDASPHLPFPHGLNRKMTRNMLCMLCKTPQPAGPTCTNCGVDSAYYYCSKCKLWDNDSTKSIYHCDDCGICRRGEGLGKDYVHCKRCNVCISISTSSTHPCVERATDCDCPLCLDYLFSSSLPVVSLACGHYMHGSCYKDLMHVTYRCPVCNKSAVNMELQWRKLDDEIRLQPMPEDEFEDSAAAKVNPTHRRIPRKVFVGCNDCGGRGWSNFHWLGLKCPHCDGYNTSQTAPLGSETPGARPIVRRHEFAGVNALPAVVTGDDERADSAYGRPSSPAQIPISTQQHLPVQQHATFAPHSPTGRSYFLQAEYEESLRNTERALSAGDAFRNLPYDILQRFSRSLSPMRYYLEGLDVSGSAAASGHTLDDTSSTPKDEQRRPQTAESRESSFWGEGNAGVFFGDVSESDEEEEEDEDAEDEDEEESEDDEDDEDSDDEDDDGVGSDFGGDRDAFHVEEDDLRLPGHM
ncbi:zf-CHY-domain-containing protein [Aureobasidium pullulans]|uniref:Zf-CHY-domain-containing protein n=1 Tax=Aureobasidium pullulans TaxID=5580 RepID=A0A4S9B5P2_AURPU|nr:zf-CHY-domain-containing protein [Aureobasidium pullulans]